MDFLVMAGAQFAYYLLLVINIRAIALGRLAWAVVTDMAVSAVFYLVVVRLAHHDGASAVIGMMVGGGVASAAGVWLTRRWG